MVGRSIVVVGDKAAGFGREWVDLANAKRPSLIDFPTLSIDCEIFRMALFDSRVAVANSSTMFCFNFNSCFSILR